MNASCLLKYLVFTKILVECSAFLLYINAMMKYL